MKKYLKIILVLIIVIILCITVDLVCIFTINRPLFAIQRDNNGSISRVYNGIFYDTYNCLEYSVPVIKRKGTKFSCSTSRINIGRVLEIVDTTLNIKDFSCAEALEEFYEDDTYVYYYSCMKSKYVIVKYESGYEESVRDALRYGSIKIEDLDTYNINYLKYEKN